MIDEIEELRRIRPAAAPPRDTARAAALAQLRAAMAASSLPARGAVGGSRRSGRTAPWRRAGLALALPVLGSAGALVVAVLAIVLLHGGGSAPHRAAIPGSLRTATGSPLTGPLVAPLKQWYRSALTAGDSLTTTIDPALQRAAQRSLARSVRSNSHATGGSFVALDPDTGAIEAIGSVPVSAGGQGRLNRAYQLAGPPGSAFKPVTALAALESHNWTPAETFDDTGKFCEGGGLCIQNSGGAAFGIVDIAKALELSDDIFFYNLGFKMNVDKPAGGPLQLWAGRLGIGKPSGIDLPAAAVGQAESPGETARRAPGIGWTAGDNVNAAVGQGDDAVSPLQLAVAYSALATGGTVPTPHVGAALTSPSGQRVRTIAPAPRRRLQFDPKALAAIRSGMRAETQLGTSGDVFGDLDAPVYGQVGTAQLIANGRMDDTGLWAGFVASTRGHGPLVVVVQVDHGGFGDVAAAPVARQIISQWLTGRPGRYRTGASSAT